MKERKPTKVVLAYSGGLDTSVILPWLKERYPGVKVVAFTAEIGVGEDLNQIRDKALRSGADEVVIRDLRQEFIEQYCFPMLRAQARYEDTYLLGTSVARPVTAAHQVDVAHETGADAVAHGCTCKGNDQVRFELSYMALDPGLQIIAPWKDPAWTLENREAALQYAQARGIPIPQTKSTLYSRDRNLWHCSHEGLDLEDPANEPADDVWLMTVPISAAAESPEYADIDFEKGTPVSVNGKSLPGHEIVARLNVMGGRHAVGQIHLVENRIIGMKSRGAYETPGGTILYEAHRALERICLERDTYHFKQRVGLEYGELVYNGKWFHPLRDALQAFVDQSQHNVSGAIRVKLFRGQVTVASVTSETSLYDRDLASFAMAGFDVTSAHGFIDLLGLPMKVDGILRRRVLGRNLP